MRIDYSKPAGDIQKESLDRLQNDKEKFEKQKRISKALLDCADRTNCILCNHRLNGDVFEHRDIPFVVCNNCGHIQTKILPPPGYPASLENSENFQQIYPKLSKNAYEDRKNRIYKPKLDWAISNLKELGYGEGKIKDMTWTEMGCGAGYFLACLEDFGVKKLKGFDAEPSLINNANEALKNKVASHYENELADSFKEFPADIYTAFFVLEHLNNSYKFFEQLGKQKSGTIFIFSVPVYGLSALLESIFTENYARSLDAVVHTQIFTDNSIEYAMQLAGFAIKAQWIFGQDADDLARIFIGQANKNLTGLFNKNFVEKISSTIDGVQLVIDKHGLSDQRHILSIKN